MIAKLLIVLLVISAGATRLALAQDVQGMSSGAAAKPAASSQERLKGEVVAVNEASGTVGIKLSGTVGSSDATAPTTFKIQDGLMFNAIKPGDRVSFTAERVGEQMTIKSLAKE